MRSVRHFTVTISAAVCALLAIVLGWLNGLPRTTLAEDVILPATQSSAVATVSVIPAFQPSIPTTPSSAPAEPDEEQIVRAVLADVLTNPKLEKLRTLLGQPDAKELLLISQSPVDWPLVPPLKIAGWALNQRSLSLPETLTKEHRWRDRQLAFLAEEPRGLSARLCKLELDDGGGWFVELEAIKLGWDERDDAFIAAVRVKAQELHKELKQVTAELNAIAPAGETPYQAVMRRSADPRIVRLLNSLRTVDSFAARGDTVTVRTLRIYYEGTRPVRPDAIQLLAVDDPDQSRTAEENVALWRRQYRFKSVRSRLEYERHSDSAEPIKQSSRQGEPINQVRPSIGAFDGRVESLRRLHYESAEKFTASPGFGLSRVPPVGPGWLGETTAAPPALQPGPSYIPLGPSIELVKEDAFYGSNEHRAPSHVMLRDYNLQARDIFLHPKLIGYVESIDRVAGFDSHQFWWLPRLRLQTEPSMRHYEYPRTKIDSWTTTQLQLVSLLKCDPPAVYISKYMPAMKELANAPTRPLDDFEQQGLKRLNGSESLVIEATTNRIRMLGGLYAYEGCTDCHVVKPGTLLGAFSYVLLRHPPIGETEIPRPKDATGTMETPRPRDATMDKDHPSPP